MPDHEPPATVKDACRWKRAACRDRNDLGASEGRLLLGDDRAALGEFGVEFFVVFPFFRKVVFVEDRLDRAFGNARFAVDAFFGVNVDHRFTFIEAFDGADDDAVRVFTSKTRLGDNVGHYLILSLGFCRLMNRKCSKRVHRNAAPKRCQVTDFSDFSRTGMAFRRSVSAGRTERRRVQNRTFPKSNDLVGFARLPNSNSGEVCREGSLH